ncbi:unnamed protein product, partial [Adineta steineri]
ALPENGKNWALVLVPECLTWNDPAAQAPYTDTYVSTVQSSPHLSLTYSAVDTLTMASNMTTDLIKNKKSVRYCHIIVPRQINLFHFNSRQISKKCVTAELIGKDDHKEETISSKRNSVISKLEKIGHNLELAPLDENLSNYDGAHDDDF